MSLFQIYYEYLGINMSRYVAAADMESAIKRFRQVAPEKIIQVCERSTDLLS